VYREQPGDGEGCFFSTSSFWPCRSLIHCLQSQDWSDEQKEQLKAIFGDTEYEKFIEAWVPTDIKTHTNVDSDIIEEYHVKVSKKGAIREFVSELCSATGV